MSLIDTVYRLPQFQDQKCTIPDFTYLNSYLKAEKQFVARTVDLVIALERFYRASAQGFISSDSKSPIAEDLPLTSAFSSFRQVRLRLSDRFLDIATRISKMLNSEFYRLRSDFDAAAKQLKTELSRLQSMIQTPLENMTASIAGYDKYFKQLQQCYLNPVQAVKAINALDEKLGRVHSSYLVFHRRFVDYCAAREPLFAEIEAIVKRENETLTDLLKILSSVDGIVVGDLEDTMSEGFSGVAEDEKEKELDIWTDEEEEGECVFQVKLVQNLNVNGVDLPVNSPFTVLDSRGDVWELRDRTGEEWFIPQMYLAPGAKSKAMNTR
jgi:hypothetical protein